ncbi:MAG: hypothetical protein A2V99_03575 [Spirochaetes bacterium RBG_16_67_19]|nr:MAG: hypothetical protein A2V99_03575 [Spirochaetes bacterium RBG_16_67_19]
MNQVFLKPCALACLLLLAAAGAWAQGGGGRDESIQRMLQIVLDNNPTLASQAALLRESEKLPAPRGGVALTGISFSIATSYYDPDTGSFYIRPAATLGASLSIADPARALNAYNLKKAREEARQEYLRIRNSLVADLFSTMRELLGLGNKGASLERLKAYLEDYSNLVEKQVRAGTASPDVDKLWNLRERIIGIEVEMQDARNRQSTLQQEAAMRLGGEAWQELFDLLDQLGE